MTLGVQPVEIARDMNVDRSTIFNIRNKTIYREISTQYEFKNITNDTLSDDIVKSICKDMEAGMSSANIARNTGIKSRDVRYIIQLLRDNGNPICATPENGYWIARYSGDLDETLNKMKSHIENCQATYEALENCRRRMKRGEGENGH